MPGSLFLIAFPSSIRIWPLISTKSTAKEDFALELNLGFQSHYDYLKSIASFDWSNQVHLLMFFSDELSLCLDRAKARHLSGGHEVKPEVIEEMYNGTIPLYEKNKNLFYTVRFIDVTYKLFAEPQLSTENLPRWIIDNNLQRHLISSAK